MNVLQVTMRDLVGRRFNGYDLHRALREAGTRSRMLVLQRASDDPDVGSFGSPGALLERGLFAAERVTGLQGLLSPLAFGFPLHAGFRDADVVHWHLVSPSYVSIPATAWAARRKPTLWTLHDPWATTGHCVHPLDCERWKTGCGRCPDLERAFPVWIDTTAMVWRRKRAAYARAPIHLVVASRWMRDRVAESPLLASMPCAVIPFGIDLERWRPADRAAARAELGIPADARAIAFRLPGGSERNRVAKGVPWLLEALERLELPGTTTLLAFEGARGLERLPGRYRTIELGWVHDEARVARALSAADVFVSPSLAESFGFMALESIACGTPVIATEGTAVLDTIRPPEAGLAVPARDASALARALAELLSNEPRRAAMGRAGRARAEADFSFADYVRRHEELYRAVAAPAHAGAA